MGILNTYTETQATSTLFTELCTKEAKIAVLGLGEEGLSTALHLASKYRVIGYDNNRDVTTVIQQEKDPNRKIESTDFIGKDFFATSIVNLLETAQFYVITTPNKINTAGILPLNKSTATVARHLKVGDVVVFQNINNSKREMDFYISILERISGLQHNTDFKTGYVTTNLLASNQKEIKSTDTKVHTLITNVFKNITTLKVIKTEKHVDVNAIAKKIEDELKEQRPSKKTYSVLLKGITSEKNTEKMENSKAVELYMALYRKGIQVKVQDNHILPSKVKATCGIELTTSTNQRFDAIVTTVEHDNYKTMKLENYKKNSTEKTLFFDNLGNRKEVLSLFR